MSIADGISPSGQRAQQQFESAVKARKRAIVEVALPVGIDLTSHTGSIGRNAEHRMTVSLCSSATSNYRVLNSTSLGYLGETWLLPHRERTTKDGTAIMFAEMHGGRLGVDWRGGVSVHV
jgi:hypothetical protein